MNLTRAWTSLPTLALALTTAAAAQPASSPAAPQDDAVLIQRGAYLARAGDCVACHSAPKGPPFAGGLPMNSPFGTIYSTNITPDPEHGIGRYSFADFDNAVRRGVAPGGRHLYPAMPYPSFAKITPDDMQALYAYFMHGVKPVTAANRPSKLTWPFSMRALMRGWNMFYYTAGAYQPDPSRSAAWNRGAYLVQGLGHCGACHTPRGIASQEKALSDKDGPAFLRGAALDNWFAPSLAGDLRHGLYGWSKEEIAEFLKTGRTAHTAAFGAMTDVVQHSTQYLSDDDLNAIGEYLKTLPGDSASQATAPSRDAAAGQAHQATLALRAGDTQATGALVYLNNCNACHRSDGSGARLTFPTLAGSEMVNSPDPTSLIHIVLKGSSMPSTHVAPTPLTMPDFAWRLSDQQVADVLTFVRSSWGNQAPAVSADAVAKVRKAIGAPSPGTATTARQ